MNRGGTGYLPRSSVAMAAALLLADSGQKTTQTAEPMTPIGRLVRENLGGQDLVMRAVSEAGDPVAVQIDSEDRVLVPESFRGRVEVQLGQQKIEILVGMPELPRGINFPVQPPMMTMTICGNYDMPAINCSFDRVPHLPPSSKRGARAANGRKPWQGNGWRASAARPGRR